WSGQHLSPRALPGMARRTLVVGSFSKSHIMTGSRIGWLIGPAPMIAQLSDLLTVTTYGVPGYIQDAALAALTDGAALEREVAETYRRRRDLALATLSGASGLSLVQPDGAMYVMVDIRATGLDGRSFAEALMQAHAVAVMPGESFGHAAAGHVRIALTADDARLTKALDKLKTFAAGLAA
ncbi:MAG: pyridoxal phosphate-dependent aminotransferase, partial [Pseudomonadota bacterium]